MPKHNELLCQIERFAATGDPYFRRVAESVASVKIHTLRGASSLKMIIASYFPEFRALPRDCYKNASTLALRLERHGVKYVEGFVSSWTGIDAHGWISFGGRYYDPTYEQNAIDLKKVGDCRKDYSYAKVIEMTATELWATCEPGGRSKEFYVPGPASPGMWGFSEDAQEFYALKAADADSVVSMLNHDRFREMVTLRQ